MKLNRIPTIAIAVLALALALPIAALADVTGTPTLTAGNTLSLDTGATSSSGGDILWNSSGITPQGSATAYNLGPGGAAAYATYTQALLSGLGSLYSKSAIAASSLPVGDVFAVKTNGGNYAKVLVTVQSGTSISLQFDTFGSSAPTGPTITQILNNYGLVPAGFTNSGISPGSLFIIKGSGLADPNAQAVLQSSASPGLQTTLNGASVKVTVGSTTTVPVFYYAIAAQLALVLPSNTPVGNATLTVSYGGQTSSPASFQVVANAMGFDAYYGTGSGLGVATNNATGALYNYTNSIPPGTTVVMWGSGLGADPTRDTTFSTSNINQIAGLSHIYIGGLDAPIVYQGPSGYPGLNQVDVTIPAGVAPGCNVSTVGVNSAGVPTNFLTLPIGNGVCSDPTFGTNGTQLQNLSGQTNVNNGALFVFQETSPVNSTGTASQTTDVTEGIFERVTGSSVGSSSGSVSLGGCIVTETGATGTTTTITTTAIDAGTITVTGPVGGTVTLTSSTFGGIGLYFAQLAAGAIPTSGGTFTFKGSGGSVSPFIGAFTASLTFPNPILSWTNSNNAATVTRSSGLGVSWTGGSSGTYVIIGGSSSATVSGQSVSGSYTCIAPVSAGSFTVPSYVLATLPAGSGATSVSNYTNYQTFTASGLDSGVLFGGTSQSVNTTYN
ncbi:MAG: hypothetical protein ABSF62_07365 [Bryobacteraceae bacterium]|jgi:uncharacterized protein (TIGR03437 family)